MVNLQLTVFYLINGIYTSEDMYSIVFKKYLTDEIKTDT